MHENTIHGLIAQNKAELRAIEKGYLISKPVTDCSRYDMIVDTNDGLKRVQVKYAGSKPVNSTGSCLVDFRKVSINGKERNGYSKEEVDAILVYIPNMDKICYFPIDLVENKTSLTICFERPKNNQTKGIVLVEDYIW